MINALKDSNADYPIIPSIMLKAFSEDFLFTSDFLDGNNLEYVRKKINHNFLIVENSNSAKEVVDFIKTL